MQSVLNIKKQIEDSLKNELAKALRVLEEEKLVLNELKEEKKRCMSDVNSEVSKGVTVEKLRNYNAYISFVKQKISNQTERVNLAKKTADKYRDELISAVKERKMLETLRDKQYSEYLKEEEKKQQKIVDEIISYKGSSTQNISGGENGSESS